MRKIYLIISAVFIFLLGCSPKNEVNILVFSKTETFRHESIADGLETINQFGSEEGWNIVATEDAGFIREENLENFHLVVFLNTTGDILDHVQQADLERYIQAGGTFAGIHSATDTEYEWPWYKGLIGAYFAGHPAPQSATLRLSNIEHPSTSQLEENFEFFEEWYNFKDIQDHIIPLVTIDENTYEGGTNGEVHPITWHHEYDGGRVWYTNMGHTPETWDIEIFQQHLREGLRSVIRDQPLDYSLAKSDRVPPENRFARTILLQNLNEPMELDILDENRILFIERRGKLREYNLSTAEIRDVAQLDTWYGLEEGLLGLAVDPDYENNHWIYMYYSRQDTTKIRLSRFVYDEGELDMESETVILEVPVMRAPACCHEAGSIEFGPDGLLYLSTGDNTNPFESSGFAPIDERPGRQAWDAQRSSGNSNDLRGKILRIRVMPDGSYEIPEGNLFEPGTPKTRPEIYTMGLRNPFRISIDPKRNWLFWGDVGPDAGKTVPDRGPKGLDELNRAKEAGFYGWPYTRGNNVPYNDYDFTTETPGPKFDPENIINDSPNNTGINELPPANESLIWYSYDESEEFPWMGTGGKNPMAGPIYYSDMYPEGHRFPDYFNGKIFFYEWMRDWIYIITMDEEGNYAKAEPFMKNTRFNNPMDMVFGKDGVLYILEYGEKWNSQNMDARLNRIEYIGGNRNPVARIKASNTSGAVPLEVSFSGDGSEDFDGDQLKYTWDMSTGEMLGGRDIDYTFSDPGRYNVKLTVTDPSGSKHTSSTEIIAGNDPPSIKIDIDPDNMMYWTGKTVNYKVTVNDKEDGEEGIDPARIKVTWNYLPEGQDMVITGHQMNVVSRGLELIGENDCIACHAVNEKVNGPSYMEISNRYSDPDKAYLVQKIIDGGSGAWGENMMSAHPQLSTEDVGEMVDYILSLSNDSNETSGLGPEGELGFTQHEEDDTPGKYILSVSYTDNGAGSVPSLAAQEQVIFHSNRLQAEDHDEASDGITVWNAGGSRNLGMVLHNRYVMFRDIDFDGLTSVKLRSYFSGNNTEYGGGVEVRRSLDGEAIGSAKYGYKDARQGHTIVEIDLSEQSGRGDLYFVFLNPDKPEQYIGNTDWFELVYRAN